MSDIGVIDRFVETFSQYIDSGFGLLGADVHFLTAVLIGIDITLAGLYWAMGPDTNVIAKFLKKSCMWASSRSSSRTLPFWPV